MPSGAESPSEGPDRGAGPSRDLFVCWLIVFAALAAVLSQGPVPERTGPLVAALTLAGLAWWRACRLAERARPSLALLVAGAVVLRALALASAPGLSDDAQRYVWEAEVSARGLSPYAFAPASPELLFLRRELPALYAGVNHPETPAAYPPLVQGAASLVVATAKLGGGPEDALVARALFGLRLLAACADLLLLVPLAALLRARGRPAALLVAWAWSPLVALEFAGTGHLDVLGIALWTAALALVVRAPTRASLRAVSLFTLGALVKFLPALSLPFVLRGQARRRALVAVLWFAGLAGLAFAPFLALEGGARMGAGLADYGLRWESTSIVYRFVEAPLLWLFERDRSLTDPRRLGRGLVFVAWLALGARLWWRDTDPLRASWILLGAFLVLSPTLHPWYLTWAVPFLALFPSRAWSWLVAASPLAYALLGRWWRDGVWQEPWWLWPVWILPFLVLLVGELREARR